MIPLKRRTEYCYRVKRRSGEETMRRFVPCADSNNCNDVPEIMVPGARAR